MTDTVNNNAQLRVAVVYTGMPTSLVTDVENALKTALAGSDYTVMTFSDPSIIADAVKNGSPSQAAVTRLYNLYNAARVQGADVILNACSSVGDYAAIAQPVYHYQGVPIVRIDEKMARTAANHRRIGVVATLRSTLEPTKRLLREKAAQAGKDIELIDILADGAFGQGPQMLAQALMRHMEPHLGKMDCVLMAQGSMEPAREEMQKLCGIPVYASPAFGAEDLRDTLRAMAKLP